MIRPDTIEIAPGKCHAVYPANASPKYALVRLMKLPNGDYKQGTLEFGQFIRMTDKTPERIGAAGMNARTLRRLMWAGFVKFRKPAPGTLLVDLESWFAHLEASKDPNFWTRERIQRYREAQPGYDWSEEDAPEGE